MTSAWLAPLLVGSIAVPLSSGEAQAVMGRAREDLLRWLDHMNDLLLTEEIALAQGFKHAANRSLRHPCATPSARGYLVERAHQMLTSARHWLSQVTLIHALTLWAMPENEAAKPISRRMAQDVVSEWVAVIGIHGTSVGPLHPFVAETADLAVQALESGQPQRFIWLDERELLARVGSAEVSRRHIGEVWLPLSAGWKALDRRAQQLVADLVVLLNLTERDGQPLEIEQRLLRTLGQRLPSCLTLNRHPLFPDRPVVGEAPRPGATCPDDCSLRLCPYPKAGSLPPRAEMSAAFCRTQLTLLREPNVPRRNAPWQGMRRVELARFWDIMRTRALRG